MTTKIRNLLINLTDGTKLEGTARLLRKRNMGKICFCDVRFWEDQIQILLSDKLTNYADLKKLPLGSMLHLYGQKMVTRAGMPSLEVIEATVLFVYNEAWPDKFHGLSDQVLL